MKNKSHHKWNLIYLKNKSTIRRSFTSKQEANKVAKKHTYYLLDKQY